MIKSILFLALLLAPAAHAQHFTHAEVYTVTGVAANDTLNVRAGPQASARDIGDLAPGQPVEILTLSEDRKWGQIIWEESNGWVSMRYLRPTPLPSLPGSEMPVQLNCGGNEPFWSANIQPDGYLEFTDYASADRTPDRQRVSGSTKAMGYTPVSFAFITQGFTGLLERRICFDGMSDRTYGWTLRLVGLQNGDLTLRNGCCRADLN